MRAVATAMTSVPTLDGSTTIQDASAAMLDEHVEAVIVVQGGGLHGLVTAGDVAGALADRDVASTPVADIAHGDPLVVAQHEPLAQARDRMRIAGVALAVVIDDDRRPVGVLPGDAGL